MVKWKYAIHILSLAVILLVSGVQAMQVKADESVQTGEHLVTSPEELEAAIAKAMPGDVIVMQNGIWKDINIVFKGQGTESEPITLKAQTRGQVIISGSSSLRMAGEYLVVDGLYFKDGVSSQSLHVIEFRVGSEHAYHSRLTNIVIDGFNKDPRKEETDVWVGLFGTHNRVDHSLFLNKIPESSTLMIVWRATADANHHKIDHNYFKDINNDGWDGDAAIRIGDGHQALSSSQTIVENNIFENMNGIGKIISLKSGGNTIRNNTFIRAQGSIAVRQGDGNLIEGNFILPGLSDRYTGGILNMGSDTIIRHNYIQGTRTSGKAAIEIYDGEEDNYPGKGGYYPSQNVTIANNTLIDNDKNLVIGQLYNPEKGIDVAAENLTIKENVILGNQNMTPLIIVLHEPNVLTYEGNQFFNGNFLGIEDNAGIQQKQPELVFEDNGMYRYAEDSPYKQNLISEPMKRTEVGPGWVLNQWDMFGLEDTLYIDLPVESLLQETEPVATAEVEDASLQNGQQSEPVTGKAAEAPQPSNNLIFWFVGLVLFAVIAFYLVMRSRINRNDFNNPHKE